MSLVCHECMIDVQPGDTFPGREGGMLRRVPQEGQTLGVALCFECLMRSSDREQFQLFLRKIFVAYNAEVEAGRDRIQVSKASQELRPRSGTTCPCCETSLGEADPSFTFTVMDRAHGERRVTLYGSYQWSDIRTGNVSFRLCASCVKDKFPRCFATLLGLPLDERLARSPEGVGQVEIFEALTDEEKDRLNAMLPPGMKLL